MTQSDSKVPCVLEYQRPAKRGFQKGVAMMFDVFSGLVGYFVLEIIALVVFSGVVFRFFPSLGRSVFSPVALLFVPLAVLVPIAVYLKSRIMLLCAVMPPVALSGLYFLLVLVAYLRVAVTIKH